MRKYLASLAFSGFLAVAAPAAATSEALDTPNASASVAVQQVKVPLPSLRDEAAMVLVGTALIALAAAVRRAA
jgi:hypothetical protein